MTARPGGIRAGDGRLDPFILLVQRRFQFPAAERIDFARRDIQTQIVQVVALVLVQDHVVPPVRPGTLILPDESHVQIFTARIQLDGMVAAGMEILTQLRILVEIDVGCGRPLPGRAAILRQVNRRRGAPASLFVRGLRSQDIEVEVAIIDVTVSAGIVGSGA